MFDLILACLHHLLIFGLFALILCEFIMLKPGIDVAGIRRVSRIDLLYGIAAVLIVIVGFSRALFAAKGWHYYSHNGWFWAKMGTFALVGLLSIPPTLTLARWRRSGTVPSLADLKPLRRLLHYELALFMLLPLFAAAMARGFGEF
jgi:putative membrane protein